MKKYIKQIATLALIAAFASCSSDDDGSVDYTSVGGNVVPTTTISRLDNNYNIPLAIFTKAGVTALKIEIYKNDAKTTSDPIVLGTKISDATITADAAVFNSSTLGSFDIFPVTQTDGTVTLTGTTGTFPLAILTTYSDGSITRATYTLTVAKGIVWKAKDTDGELTVTTSTSGVSTVRLNDPTPVKINYATVKKATTTVNTVVGEWSKNGGAYTALPGEFSTSAQTIDVAAIPYTTYGGLVNGDYITYRFTVTAGTQKDEISTKITFVDQDFDALSGSGSVDNADTTSQFSFLTAKNYDGASTDAEIKFNEAFGIAKSGETRITFVKPATALDYDATNLEEGEVAFATGTKVTELADLTTGDVILYKITRSVNFGTDTKPDLKDVTYNGLLKITDKTAGSTSQKLSFSYKEGELILAD